MKHTVRKLLFAWQFEEEEKWLNEMSAKGFQLVSVGLGKYVFEDKSHMTYQYGIELLDHWPTHPESINYIKFLEETGTEHVASFMRWIYIRKEITDDSFELFSDLDSRIKHLKKIRNLFFYVSPLIIINIINMIRTAMTTSNAVIMLLLILNVIFAILLGKGLWTIHNKIQALIKEKSIRE